MGLILDTSEIVAAERRGLSVLQILEHIRMICGEIDLGLSVVTIAELMHGAYRTKSDPEKQRGLAFIDRPCLDIPVYPVTLTIARLAGRIEGELASRGTTLAFEDVATHLALQKATPAGRLAATNTSCKVVSMPRLGGLHHRYDLAA